MGDLVIVFRFRGRIDTVLFAGHVVQAIGLSQSICGNVCRCPRSALEVCLHQDNYFAPQRHYN